MDDKNQKPIRLLFHIGMGKTGTSAIQEALLKNRNKLGQNGIFYLGMNLENAPIKIFNWQRREGAYTFFKLAKEDALTQANQILQESIIQLRENKIHTLIWSNETFFDNPHLGLKVINFLKQSGVSVEVVAYIRNPVAWAKSAYIQWGIKHKTYKNKIISFSEYFQKKPVNLKNRLSKWISHDFKLNLRNYDQYEDIVRDFSQLINFTIENKKFIKNKTPDLEEIFLRSLFNNLFDNEVRPIKFDTATGIGNHNLDEDIDSWFQSLLPSKNDLDLIHELSKDDVPYLNNLLILNSQEKLCKVSNEEINIDINTTKLLYLVTKITMYQGKKISDLEKIINRLTEDEKAD